MIPTFFTRFDIDELTKVANNLEFKTGIYFRQKENCDYDQLNNHNGVLFTDKFSYQGCESKLLIHIQEFDKMFNSIDVEAQMNHIDATLRCVTKLVDIETFEEDSYPTKSFWNIYQNIIILILWLGLINWLSLSTHSMYLLSSSFFLFTLTPFFRDSTVCRITLDFYIVNLYFAIK